MLEYDMFEAEFTGETGEETGAFVRELPHGPHLALRLLSVAESEMERLGRR